MAIPTFRLQRNDVQHGGVSEALCVRILESVAHPRRWQEGTGGDGHFGRIGNLLDLPGERTLIAYVRKAAALNDAGVTTSRAKPRSKTPLVVPDDLAAALTRKAAARRTFESFSPSHKREYVDWITGAKREQTRKRRLQKAIEWMGEGKVQNWKYM